MLNSKFLPMRIIASLYPQIFKLALVVAVVLFCFIPAHAQTTSAGEETIFFYSGGKKNELKPSTEWVAVQLEDDASASTVEAAAKGQRGVDKSKAAMHMARKHVLSFPIELGVTAATRQQLRAQLKSQRGVHRILRTFGKGQFPIIETDEFLINFEASVTKAQARVLVQRHGAQLIKSLGSYAPNGYVARVLDPDTTSATDAANALYAEPGVVWSHPDFIWPKQRRFAPNDPLYTSQWHLNNTGQGGGTPGADVKAAAAWDISRGSSSVIIAIIDDGLDIDHPDLVGRTVAGYDFIDHDSDPRPGTTTDNHGTACAGVAAANGNNGIGVTGVAPNVKIMPIRLIGGYISLQDEADAFTFAANNGAYVISNSWGPADGTGATDPLPDSTRTAINYAVTSGRGGKGCVVLWAAGNGNESADLDGYSSNPQVISVAASTNQDVRAYYSDYGSSVDICAPSNGGTLSITTIDRTGSVGYSPANGFSQPDYTNDFGGTSSATPLAAGVAALVLSVNNNLTATQVQTLLQNSADKIDTAGGAYDASGHSDKYGYGRVNALRALQAASPTTTYTVSGHITTSTGTAVSGVTVAASTSVNTGTTDSTGSYSVTGVPAGTVTITPTKSGYTFTPTSRSITVSGNTANVDFTAVINPAVTLTAPADNASIGASTTLRADTQGAIQSVAFSRRQSGSFTRTPNLAIPDATTVPGKVTDSGTISTSATIAEASLSVNITHTYIGDLTVVLIAPDGTRLTVHDQTGAGTDNLIQTYPNLALVGKQMAGTWQLEVTDNQAQDTGTLVSWSLNLGAAWVSLGNGTQSSTNVWTAPWSTLGTTPGTYQVRAVATYASGTLTDINNNITVVPSYFSVNGRVATSAGTGINGVHLSLSGSSITATTNTNGDFTLANVPVGTYTLTPSLSGYNFTPTSRSVSVTNANVTGQNFTGAAIVTNYSISGRIATSSNVGIANVSVTRTGSTTPVVTDANGNYTFTGVPAGSYNITPVLAQYSFSPTMKSVAVSSANVTGVNFTGTRATYTIRGRVANHSGNGLPNIQITRTGGSNVLTDANGNYVFSNVISGNYTIAPLITPSLNGVTMYPASRAVTVGTSSLSNQNFTASFSVTGKVANSLGVGIPNIQVKRVAGASTVSVFTDTNGNYRFSNVYSGTYTVQAVVTPAMTGMTFYPASTTITVDKLNLTNINFIGWFSISGRVTNSSGTGMAGVQVQRRSSGGSVVSVFTDSSGNYRFSDVRSGDYTISAALTGKTFTPASRSVTVGTLNLTNINFTGY